jgi:hypothetical protein
MHYNDNQLTTLRDGERESPMITATLSPISLRTMLNKLDEDSTAYSFNRTGLELTPPFDKGVMHFTLWIDGGDSVHLLTLNLDGTFIVRTKVQI